MSVSATLCGVQELTSTTITGHVTVVVLLWSVGFIAMGVLLWSSACFALFLYQSPRNTNHGRAPSGHIFLSNATQLPEIATELPFIAPYAAQESVSFLIHICSELTPVPQSSAAERFPPPTISLVMPSYSSDIQQLDIALQARRDKDSAERQARDAAAERALLGSLKSLKVPVRTTRPPSERV